MTEKRCSTCGLQKPHTEFNRKSPYVDGRERRRAQCKACEAERKRKRNIAMRRREQIIMSKNDREWSSNERDENESRLTDYWINHNGPECTDEQWEFFCKAMHAWLGVPEGTA